MVLSETVIAAMIGALATVSTALFQLITALRARARSDVKPRRGSTLRSVLAVLALMVASGVGGFIYAELRAQSEDDHLRALHMELQDLKAITARMTQSAASQPVQMQMQISQTPPAPATFTTMQSATEPAQGRAHVAAHAGPCVIEGAACDEASAQRVSLCSAIPASAHVTQMQVFVATVDSNEVRLVTAGEDLGGARFSAHPLELAHDAQNKTACVEFANWSAESRNVRVAFDYLSDTVTHEAEPVVTPIAMTPAMMSAEIPTAMASRQE